MKKLFLLFLLVAGIVKPTTPDCEKSYPIASLTLSLRKIDLSLITGKEVKHDSAINASKTIHLPAGTSLTLSQLRTNQEIDKFLNSRIHMIRVTRFMYRLSPEITLEVEEVNITLKRNATGTFDAHVLCNLSFAEVAAAEPLTQS